MKIIEKEHKISGIDSSDLALKYIYFHQGKYSRIIATGKYHAICLFDYVTYTQNKYKNCDKTQFL